MQGNNRGRLPAIRHTAVFQAPIQKVWEAVSTSEGIAAWLMPNDFQPKVGYEFTLQTPFGPTPCKVMEIDPPHRLSFAWGEFGWRVSFELKELEGKTQFTLTHSGWGEPDETIPESGLNHSEAHNRMDHGWKSIVTEKLREVVEA
ncbi:SRPBCC family protein [Polycladomyces subterraneus]|uniref:SRPBCC domain-containing protein n=1 Tax=Polycladomyces subterraneus TaxID=1016997 RepID=A0ABT8IKT4_9BACL|nr:SRPBCC domain-containing protein [Polycladomyces subterraneus]MDN4593393.1 SRPBCC domain-containing protein [Polycladomyces subterraneus]